MAYNPFIEFDVTGDWASHASYSAGGTDYPTPYGWEIHAPAAGVLHTSGKCGGGFEFQCGMVGSAGRRSILMLDTPLQRQESAQSSPPEGDGDMVAIVFQHQSQFGEDGKHYDEGEAGLGWTGASANGNDHGGDTHIHIHGLTAGGNRVRVESFITASTPTQAQETTQPGEDEMAYIRTTQRGFYTAAPGVVISHPDTSVLDGIAYRKWATIMDVADADLEKFLFAIAGCGKYDIPPVGGVWYGGQQVTSASGVDASAIAAQVQSATEAALQGTYKVVKA